MRINVVQYILIVIIKIYRRFLSPLKPRCCRFQPTCSEYAMEAVIINGAVRGSIQAIWRILRCNPWGGSGYDPVNVKKR